MKTKKFEMADFFRKCYSRSADREVDFEKMPTAEKIALCVELGANVPNEETKLETIVSIPLTDETGKRVDDSEIIKSLTSWAAKAVSDAERLSICNKIAGVLGGAYREDTAITFTKVRAWGRFNETQKLDHLRKQIDLPLNASYKLGQFGGENVLAALKAVREMTAEDFDKLLATITAK